jgi:HSP20 family protein
MIPFMFRRGDLFSGVDRFPRELQQVFGVQPDIRGLVRGSFPALNIGNTPQTVEVFVSIPGINPNDVEVQLERGVLTITGARPGLAGGDGQQNSVHINERFAGRFRKVVSLPDDIDPDAVTANCRDGVLHISIKRRQEMQARRITVH